MPHGLLDSGKDWRRLSYLPYPDELTFNFTEGFKSKREDICSSAKQPCKRWALEYLTSLREFHKKSGSKKQSIKIGDMVLIQEEGPRMKWKLGMIKEIVKGEDSFVSSAKLRTKMILSTYFVIS